MKRGTLFGLCSAALATAGLHAEDFVDRVDEALTVSAAKGRFRARVSGTLDLSITIWISRPPA